MSKWSPFVFSAYVLIVSEFKSCSFGCAISNFQDKVVATPSSKETDVIPLDCVGRIERQLNGANQLFYVVNVAGLTLEGAKKYRLNLRILNPFDETIKYSHVATSCGCARFGAEQNEFRALGTAELVMDLETPNHIEVLDDQVTAKFFTEVRDVSPILRLDVSYSLQGVFGFQNPRVIVEVPKSEPTVTVKMPIIMIAPVKLNELELFHSDNLRDFGVQVVSDDPESSVPYVKIEIVRRNLPRQGLTGEIGLRRVGSNARSGTMVSVRHQNAFTLRPESIRLSRDNNSKPYQAFAMLRVSETIVDEKGGLEENEGSVRVLPEVELSIDGKPASVKVQRLGKTGLYRVMVQHDGPFEDVAADGTVKVRWAIVFNGEDHVIESYALLPGR
jgi:hypothetical protein